MPASEVLPLPTNYLTVTPHVTSPPNAAGTSVRDAGIGAGVCVSAVLVVTLGTLAAVIAIHRRKAKGKSAQSESVNTDRSRRDNHNVYLKDNAASVDNLEVTGSDHHYEMIPHLHQQIPLSHNHQQKEEQLTQNFAHVSTPSIPVEANVCYGITTAVASVEEDSLYVNI